MNVVAIWEETSKYVYKGWDNCQLGWVSIGRWQDFSLHMNDQQSNCIIWKTVKRWGCVVAQLVEALLYKSRVRFPMVSLEFFIDIILLAALGPGVNSACNRNECQEYFLGVKAACALPPSCADCLEIWEPQPPQGLSRPVTGLLFIKR